MTRIVYTSPVGTSLLSNLARDKTNPIYSKYFEVYKDLGEWYRVSPSDERNIFPSGSICTALNDQKFLEDLTKFVVDKKNKSCAEANGILGIFNSFGHRYEDIEIVMFYTNTCNTILVFEVIKRGFEQLGFRNITGIEVKSIANVDDFDKGLIEILDKIVTLIKNKKDKGYRVYVNATPGFKSETAFLTIASILIGVDAVIYIHESFDTPIILPHIPIKPDLKELETLIKNTDNEGKIHIHEFLSIHNNKKLSEYREKGLIKIEGEYIRIRPWIKNLIQLIEKQ